MHRDRKNSRSEADREPESNEYSIESLAHDERHVDIGSSSIKDTFDLQKLVSLKTTSGSIKARMSVIESGPLNRTIITSQTSGSLDLDFLTALGPISQSLKVNTTNTSGSVKATIPDDFRGTIYVSVSSGSVKMKEKDEKTEPCLTMLRDIKEPKKPDGTGGKRCMVAIRGVQKVGQGSEIRIDTTSGSVRLTFEKKPEKDWMKNLPADWMEKALATEAAALTLSSSTTVSRANSNAPVGEEFESAAAEKRRLAKAEEARAEAASSMPDGPPTYDESETGAAPDSYRWNTGIDHQ